MMQSGNSRWAVQHGLQHLMVKWWTSDKDKFNLKESGRTWVTTYIPQRFQQDIYFISISLIFKTSEHFQNNDKLSKFHYQA